MMYVKENEITLSKTYSSHFTILYLLCEMRDKITYTFCLSWNLYFTYTKRQRLRYVGDKRGVSIGWYNNYYT